MAGHLLRRGRRWRGRSYRRPTTAASRQRRHAQPRRPSDTFARTSPPMSRLSRPPGIRAASSWTVQGCLRKRATAITATKTVITTPSAMAAPARRSGTFFPGGASWAPTRPTSRSVTRYSRPATASIHRASSWLTPRLDKDPQDHDVGDQIARREHAPHCLAGYGQPGQGTHAHADAAGAQHAPLGEGQRGERTALGHDRSAQPDPRRMAQAPDAGEQLGPAARHRPRGNKQARQAEECPDPAAPPDDPPPRSHRPQAWRLGPR